MGTERFAAAWSFLLGILDKEQFANRKWSPMYGYTEITPGRIRVNEIISSDGNTYFDLQNNEIGGRINFKDGLISGSLFAGTTEENRANAPFRVNEDGQGCVYMSNAIIDGESVFKGQIKPNHNNTNTDKYDSVNEKAIFLRILYRGPIIDKMLKFCKRQWFG